MRRCRGFGLDAFLFPDKIRSWFVDPHLNWFWILWEMQKKRIFTRRWVHTVWARNVWYGPIWKQTYSRYQVHGKLGCLSELSRCPPRGMQQNMIFQASGQQIDRVSKMKWWTHQIYEFESPPILCCWQKTENIKEVRSVRSKSYNFLILAYFP